MMDGATYSMMRCGDTPENCDGECEFGQFTDQTEQCQREMAYVIIEHLPASEEFDYPARNFHWMHVCDNPHHNVVALSRAAKGII